MFKKSDRLTTRFCVVSKYLDMTRSVRLIAGPSPNDFWCTRKEFVLYTDEDGANGPNPFSLFALARDAFNRFADYTMTRKEAIYALMVFENSYAVKDRNYTSNDIPHFASKPDLAKRWP